MDFFTGMVVLAVLAIFLGLGVWNRKSAKRRAEIERQLCREFEIPYRPRSAWARFLEDNQTPKTLEATFFGFPVRLTHGGTRVSFGCTELRVALRAPLPGGLRILPRRPDERNEQLECLEVKVPGLEHHAWVLADDQIEARRYLEDARRTEALEAFVLSHPGAQVLNGELVVEGPPPSHAHALKSAAERMVALARALDEPAGERRPERVAVSEPEPPSAHSLPEVAGKVALTVVSALEAGSGSAAQPPGALGPVGEHEAALRAEYRAIQMRASIFGLAPMAVGFALLLWAGDVSGSVESGGVGLGLTLAGLLAYFLLLKCPECGARFSKVWRTLVPTECPRCGLRLR